MSKVEKRLDNIEQQIRELFSKAEQVKTSDPDNAMVKARKACETICREICLKESLIDGGKKSEAVSLNKMISLIGQHNKAPRYIRDDMMTIQWKGNTASHPQETVNVQENAAEPALAALSNVTKWYFSQYGSQHFRSLHEDEPEIVTKGRRIIKNPTFEKAAIGLMSGAAIAIACKIFGKKKES